ncbi:MAG TPA: pyrroloquinoline quinone-dependent dehydrogenase [Vicinamibacterales bacterium]|nr:pyrroloquinoline quinone-dependent dehydrogenase [Vicinamibacterales bacterium]
MRSTPIVALSALSLAGLALVASSAAPPIQEWPVYAADAAATHYSPLTDIDRTSVARLEVAWEWKTGDDQVTAPAGARPGSFENTPLMIDNVLYVSTPYNRVVALDAETGKPLWEYDPKAYEEGQPPNGTGFVHRGLAAWRDGANLRVFINSRAKLVCLDAKTGEPINAFGDHGVVDLTKGLRWPVDPKRYTNTSPPVVYRNLIILGNGVGDRMTYRQDPPGDVRAFDVRTGRQVWSFHTVPGQGEPGVETWGDESWKTTGHTNVWAPMSLDESRGLLYLPVSTPSNDFYGGRRPGQNLYGDSIVCLDAATGKLKWYFQVAHHGLWDYDPASAPAIVSMTVNGRKIDGVVQLTKQGFVFVFDRVTGQPVWPIEERPAPASDVNGEHAWPTQPFPTRPAAISPQGMTLDDAFDLTPALKAAAQEELKKYRLGPVYTPPSVQGTFQRPGVIGGANWGGSAFDAATGFLYVKTSHLPAVVRIVPGAQANNRPGESDADFAGAQGSATFAPPAAPGAADVNAGAGGTRGGRGGAGRLPLVKPPYGEVVAINLNTGDIAWRVPFGDMPSLRNHPALKDVPLPAALGSAGAPGVIVTKGGLVIGGTSDDSALHALDAATGKELWHLALSHAPSATPMTYRSRSGRQFVVVATGSGVNAGLVALAVK